MSVSVLWFCVVISARMYSGSPSDEDPDASCVLVWEGELNGRGEADGEREGEGD